MSEQISPYCPDDSERKREIDLHHQMSVLELAEQYRIAAMIVEKGGLYLFHDGIRWAEESATVSPAEHILKGHKLSLP